LEEKWPVLGRHARAVEWLRVWVDLGRAARTIDAYARGLAEYLELCDRDAIDPVTASRADVAKYVRELTARPSRRGANVIAIDSGAGLANATLQQRLVPVRLFYDFLIEEGLRESNPVGRGRYTPGRRFGGQQRGLLPRLTKLPWIPSEQQWLDVLRVAAGEPVRNRVMLALAYDAALRREELCALRTDDVDPAHRTLRVRAETTGVLRTGRWSAPDPGPQPHATQPTLDPFHHDSGQMRQAATPQDPSIARHLHRTQWTDDRPGHQPSPKWARSRSQIQPPLTANTDTAAHGLTTCRAHTPRQAPVCQRDPHAINIDQTT
jgi:integrase